MALSVLPGVGGYPDGRWRDYASNDYDQTWSEGYDYGDAAVTLSYSPSDPTNLRGQVVASGLKPNFTYQVKLEGKPEAEWGTDGDDATNELLGYMGRWWQSWPTQGNRTDADYESRAPSHIYRGYLLIDYFCTDGYGDVNYAFVADNSFHVLWKTSQRTPGSNDSTPTSHTLDPHDGYGYYSPGLPSVETVDLYGEWEPTRALPGELVMTSGDYDCRFILTEEDFHETMNWTSVLGEDAIQFTIGQPAAIQLASFLVRPLGRRAAISWRAAAEVAVAGYRLQALRPQGWTDVRGRGALLPAAGGVGAAYEVTDERPAQAYRLQAIGLNGSVQASQVLWAPLAPGVMDGK
ncbi:MAG: hypothetical protein ACE5R4_09505 [Armatimonadota bacterium]